jgi:hypothetical protein
MKRFVIDHPEIKEPFHIDTSEFDMFEELEVHNTNYKNEPFGFIRIEAGRCSHIFLSVRSRFDVNPVQWTFKRDIYMIYDRESELLNKPFIN